MLRPRKKLSRREIKEDPLVTTYVRVQKFIQRHSKQLNIVGLIVVAAIVITVFMGRSKRSAETAAAGRLGIAEMYYWAQDYTRAVGELSNIVDTYSGTKSAGTAAFLTANAYYAQDDYANAEKYFRLYLDDYGHKKMFTASSLAGIAACRESQGAFLEAAQLYERAGTKIGNSSRSPFYLKDAGRCYVLAGEIDKGKAVYETIIDKYTDSSIKQEVEFLYESL